jgi:RHS repeat-associated protein
MEFVMLKKILQSTWLSCGLIAGVLIQSGFLVTPGAAVLAISLLPNSVHSQQICEQPDTDFDGDDPDPCAPPAQVDPAATGPADSATIGQNQCGGCTTWAFSQMAVSLQLHDRPVSYTPPLGPAIQFDLYYSQRDVQQPTKFTYANFGPQWTSSYLSYVTDTTAASSTANLYQRGGGAELYSFGGSTTSQPGPYSQAVLVKTMDASGNTTGFTRQLKDGSVEQFSQASGNQFFMTAIIDRHGNKVSLSYDNQMRIASLTDAVGQVTTLAYKLASDPLKVTQVTDPFGRSGSFTYNASGQLSSVTDVLGITSAYTYGAGNFVNALKTPYGTTAFSYGDSTTDSTLGTTRFLMITDALGRVSRVEFNQNAPGAAQTDASVPSGMNTANVALNQRNTYIWNPNQYAAATANGALDYTKAKAIHWMANVDGSVSRVIESVLEPLESRVWYDYPGQPAGSAGTVGTSNTPLHIGRVLSDGSTQLQTFQYNGVGNLNQITDPVGRQFTYTYAANGIDLLTIANTTGGTSQLLAAIAYNSQHEPLNVTGVNGATAKYQYNSAGQPTQLTDELGNATIYTYDTSGHLTGIQGPVTGATYAFTYDSVGRIASATDPAGSTVSYTYDAADRPTSAIFPDGTSSLIAYNLLDLASTTDRLGQKTTLTFDAQRELTQVADPLGQVVKLGYGSDGMLTSIVDPNGNMTTVTVDLEGRVVSKKYADGSVQNITFDTSTSRVQSLTDALNQQTSYSYNADDTLASVSYAGALTPTAGVSYSYDPAFSRVISMLDGIGTTAYAYYAPGSLGANQLQSVSGPIAGAASGSDTVTYTYDALNRVVGRSINGNAETTIFDALGRTTSVTNPLDAFTFTYADATARVSGVTSNHGPQTALSYFGPKGDELLQQLSFKGPGGISLAQFGFTYNADDNVTGFTESYLNQKFAMNAISGRSSGFMSSLLASLVHSGGSTSSVGAHAGWMATVRTNVVLGFAAILICFIGGLALRTCRRLAWPALFGMTAMLAASCGGGGGGGSAAPTPTPTPTPTPSDQITSYSYDAANRLVSGLVGTNLAAGSGSPQFAYVYDAASNLSSITANGPAHSLSYTSTNAINSGTYDANGNPATLGSNSYTWDAAHRIVTFVSGNNESDFTYDGNSHLVRIVDKQSGAVVADKGYFWCGAKRCLEHDNTQTGSPVSKQYFSQGLLIGTVGYYYVTDQLGSVRQLVDASGKVAVQYDYDPFGNQTTVSGTVNSDIGYAGYFHHAASGLNFARFRAYDSQNQRWLNRDPIGEVGGTNIYEYAGGNPVSFTDPSGRCPMCVGAAVGAVSGGAAGYVSGGWQGAIAGAAVGGAVGAVAPWLSEAAGAAAGGGVAGFFASTGTFIGLGGASGAAATIGGNYLTDQPWTNDLGWGIGIGVMAPIASGEAFVVGAAGAAGAAVETTVGATAGNIFSGYTGILGIAGAAVDPNSEHGFSPKAQSCPLN